ncbi:Putative amino-acid ABC transporter-binding protein YhdW [Seminavis robusta]|uniref:Amino-acid ABC transporter-binding protein YhdW n=1 Tax=Seminavis robusta TaxID=568900 RepID=A0A9N8ELU2_9STRA|nr:Putative amino-acid ABC transporter-binding protein YhdW [Seminavis robusta]|eukprot:Sro1422_g271330.1 Putative amino-acid ABC transporter-binding protein YhdW (926) ;mRNA; r:16477-19445
MTVNQNCKTEHPHPPPTDGATGLSSQDIGTATMNNNTAGNRSLAEKAALVESNQMLAGLLDLLCDDSNKHSNDNVNINDNDNDEKPDHCSDPKKQPSKATLGKRDEKDDTVALKKKAAANDKDEKFGHSTSDSNKNQDEKAAVHKRDEKDAAKLKGDELRVAAASKHRADDDEKDMDGNCKIDLVDGKSPCKKRDPEGEEENTFDISPMPMPNTDDYDRTTPGAYGVDGPGLLEDASFSEPDANLESFLASMLVTTNVEASESPAVYPAELVVTNPPEVGEQLQEQQQPSEPRMEIPHGSNNDDAVVIEGKAVSDRKSLSRRKFELFSLLGIAVLVGIVVALSLALSGTFSSSDEDNNNNEEVTLSQDGPGLVPEHEHEPKVSTLERIRQRGSLRAAMGFFPHSVLVNGTVVGRDADLARAVAAGALGSEAEVEFMDIDIKELFQSLGNGTIDVMIIGITHTMERDVFMEHSQESYDFSRTPYMYEGVRAAGDPFHVLECADKNFRHIGECSGLKVCVPNDSTQLLMVEKYLPARHIVLGSDFWDAPYKDLVNGDCNVLVEEDVKFAMPLVEEYLSVNGSKISPQQFTRGRNYYSVEPYSILTASTDPSWTDFVNAMLQSLLTAEYHNITQETADTSPQTNVFGEDYKDSFRHAIAQHGNFGEIYDRNLDDWQPRSTLNFINDGTTGLLQSPPFGHIQYDRNDAPLGDTFQRIVQRGNVRCGIVRDRPGFAMWNNVNNTYHGMDVDYCHALAAALFGGDKTAVQFVEIEGQDAANGYALLNDDDIDVLAGATWTLETDVKEPTTGQGYSFSLPYFYGYSTAEDNFCLATRQSDHDWSTFAYWIVAATVNAEENGITSMMFHSMPEVYVYGPAFRRMFRDSILAVGNYAELYERNLQSLFPRQGRNLLNSAPNNGPQHYLLPGFGF